MPKGPQMRLTMTEFCMKVLAEAAEFFVRTVNNELTLQRTISAEGFAKLQQELKE